MGGLTGAQCPGALPRDEKQVANARQSIKKPQVAMSITSVGDEWFMLMQQSKLGDSQGLFVRELKAAPEPGVVVARDYQLQDLVRFCTNEHNFSVLTADPTFCLGDFDVTPITYRHLLLKSRRTDRPPVFVGPLLIHYRKTFSSYLFFSSSLVGLKPELEGVRAFGTDGEENLAKALAHTFTFGVHLTCFIHMKRNINMIFPNVDLMQHHKRRFLTTFLATKLELFEWKVSLIVAIPVNSMTSLRHASLCGSCWRKKTPIVKVASMTGL